MQISRFLLIGFTLFFIVFSQVSALDTRETAYQEVIGHASYIGDLYFSVFSSGQNRKILNQNHIPYKIALRHIGIRYEEIHSLSDTEFYMRMYDQENRTYEMNPILSKVAKIRQEFYENPEAILPLGILQYIEGDNNLPGDIIILYQNKLYLSFIEKANEYLGKNPANQEMIKSLYRAYFITGNYDESMRFIEEFRQYFPEEFTHTSIGCDAFVIATYAKDIKSRRSYNKICSAQGHK